MVTIAVESLASCMACDLAMLDNGESLLDILHELHITHMSVLADRSQPHNDQTTHSTVGIVFGSVRRRSHVQRLRQFREKVDVLLAMGTCAVTGGVPAMALLPGADLNADMQQHRCTVAGPGSDSGTGMGMSMDFGTSSAKNADSDEDLLSACLPVNHYVRVDLEVPGCPPHPDWIAECLLAMLDARTPQLPQRSVCDHCPASRTGSAPLDSSLSRMLVPLEAPLRVDMGRPQAGVAQQDVAASALPSTDSAGLADLPCLLEQGFLCMGPVTKGGCGGKGHAPRCINAYAPCRGCHGPAHNRPTLVDYVGVLAAAGYDLRSIPDMPGFLSRFNGMHMLKNYRKDG